MLAISHRIAAGSNAPRGWALSRKNLGDRSRDSESMMATPFAAMPATTVPAASAPPVPAAMIPMPPPRPIVTSPAGAVVARVVAVVRVPRITVIAAVPRIIERRTVAAAKRENHLSRSRARRGKEDEASRKQTNQCFHALNLRPASEPHILF